MKLIIAIIRPERLDAVQSALQAALDEGDRYRLTAQTVDGHGRQEGEIEYFRGQPVRQRMVQKTQITIGRMPRTMLRYAIERFPEAKRKKYLKGSM